MFAPDFPAPVEMTCCVDGCPNGGSHVHGRQYFSAASGGWVGWRTVCVGCVVWGVI